MRVLLVGNYLPDRQFSMQRFARELERELRARGIVVELFIPPTRFGHLPLGVSGAQKWLGYLDKYLLAPIQLRMLSRRFDVVHVCDHSNAPYLRWIGMRAHVITCHDLLAIRAANGEFAEVEIRFTGRVLQSRILAGLKIAKRIVCVSEQTARDVGRLVGILPGRVSVVYSGVEQTFTSGGLSEHSEGKSESPQDNQLSVVPGTPYFIHVGADAWYKNRAGVLHLFKELGKFEPFREHLLVIAGGASTSKSLELSERLGLCSRIIYRNSLSDAELSVLYRRAEALLFPSWAEGFGWPLVEAQASGCLVCTSRAEPMLEIAGPGAVYFDPKDPSGAAAIIAAAVGTAEREQLRQLGFANAAKFSVEAFVNGYLNVYQEVLDRKQSGDD